MTQKIWCLFGVANDYNQPHNNLIAWWFAKPSFETLLLAMQGVMSNDHSVVATANVLQGGTDRIASIDYRLEEVPEGVKED